MPRLYVYTTAQYRHLNGKRDYVFVQSKELQQDASLRATVNNSVQVGSRLVRVGDYCPVTVSSIKY